MKTGTWKITRLKINNRKPMHSVTVELFVEGVKKSRAKIRADAKTIDRLEEMIAPLFASQGDEIVYGRISNWMSNKSAAV